MDWLQSICWIVALVLFAVVEGITVGLVSVWFAVGALAALITAAFTDSVLTQVIVFLAVSAVALIALRPLARRSLERKREATNADRVIGAVGVVTEEIDNLRAAGQVSMLGNVWTARSEDGAPIPKDTQVRAVRIEGVKLIVTPAQQPCAAPHT